jgi:hypothetical protein
MINQGGIDVEVRDMSKKLSKTMMDLADEVYKKNEHVLQQEYIDVYSNAYTLGYNEAWNKFCSKRKRLFNHKPTNYTITCSAVDNYVKHRDVFERDFKSTHDAFQFGFLSGYMMCWNCMEEVKDKGIYN